MRKKYIKEIDCYRVNIHPSYYEGYMRNLHENKPLTPEIVGMLLGKARPVFRYLFCVICKKKMEEGTQVKPNFTSLINIVRDAHQACYDKEREKSQK